MTNKKMEIEQELYEIKQSMLNFMNLDLYISEYTMRLYNKTVKELSELNK